MVSPTLESKFLSALQSRGLVYSLKFSDVEELINASMMVSTYNEGDHGMDWDNFHDLDTIYAWFDYLEGTYIHTILINYIY
jgi:hypothetical protein